MATIRSRRGGGVTVLGLAVVGCCLIATVCRRPPAVHSVSLVHRVVLQEHQNDCGLAALATLFGELRQPTTLSNVSSGVAIPPHGLSMLQLRQLALQRGVHLTGVLATDKDPESLSVPWIAHWDEGVRQHYVVVDAVTHDDVTVSDPAAGVIEMRTSDFVRHWSGKALVVNH